MVLVLSAAGNTMARKIPGVLSVADLYRLTVPETTPCKQVLKHEGKKISLSGYIQALNIFPSEDRFHLFGDTLLQTRVEVHVKKHPQKILNRLTHEFKGLPGSELKPFRLRGRISSSPVFFNGECRKAIFIDLYRAGNFRVIQKE